jgi:hypothetical protein
MTVRIGGQDSWREKYWETAAEIGQSGQASQNRTVAKNSRDRTARTGKRGKDGQFITASKGQLGQENGDRTAETGTTVAGRL